MIDEAVEKDARTRREDLRRRERVDGHRRRAPLRQDPGEDSAREPAARDCVVDLHDAETTRRKLDEEAHAVRDHLSADVNGLDVSAAEE